MATERGSNLEDYLDKAHGNVTKILKRGGVWIRLVRDIDAAFVHGAETLQSEPGTVVGAFLIGSHSSWLAAANLGLAMHVAEACQPLRACLESACYAYRIRTDAGAWHRWSRRPTLAHLSSNPAEANARKKLRRDVGREFSVSAITAAFPSSLAPLQTRIMALYEELIDFGGHFNFPVVNRAFRATGAADDNYSAELKILFGGEADQTFCFRKMVETGVVALEVLDAAIHDQWDSGRIRSAIAATSRALAKRPKSRLARRRRTT